MCIRDRSSGVVLSSSKSDEQGSFLTCLPLGNDYALNVNKTRYLFHSENFSLSEQSSLSDPYQLNIALYPIPETTTAVAAIPEKATPIILKNVFFESGSAALKSISVTELTRLKELLEFKTSPSRQRRREYEQAISQAGDKIKSQIDQKEKSKAVSYTHLTLPTIYSV